MASNRLVDGSLDFSAGVDSGKATTIASELNPNGLARSQLAWLINGTVRGGCVNQRTGWQPLIETLADGTAWWQGGYIYEPPTGSPYLVCSIGGVIYSALLESPYTITDLSAANGGLVNPAATLISYFCQAEQFLVIQAGDYVTNPLFWDGTTLSRSNGFVGASDPTNEIPPAGPMDYHMGRLWYAGYPGPRDFGAGDIVGSAASGTAPYSFKDSVLKCTENLIIFGGDGFTVPDNAGNIRALSHSGNLDSNLGQGPLLVFTRKRVYAMDVPVTRAEWVAAKDDNRPRQKVAQLKYGATGDRSIVPVNSDLFYQSMEPGIRSLNVAQRFFEQWGNVRISSNVDRVLDYNDRGLLQYASGIEFDNRMYQTAYPFATPCGVAHKALVVLDYDLISAIGEKRAPAWEGVHEGLDFLQLFTGDFGGRDRAFGVVVSRDTGAIQVWELTDYERRENGDNRVTWIVETPAYTAGQEFRLKQLETVELWIERLSGTVDFKLEFRPDGDPCWHEWAQWQLCSARHSGEDMVNPVCYPLDQYRESYRAMVAMPRPPSGCASNGQRPINTGYQFQCKLTITGWCRIRGLLMYMLPLEKTPFEGMVCATELQGVVTSCNP